MQQATTRDELICGHVDVARRIAREVARRCPPWVVRDDLIGAGMVGLVEAADRFDGARGESFAAFAEHRIRGAIRDELRRGDVMSRRARRLARTIASAIRELERDGEPVNDQRIAASLGIEVDAVREARVVHLDVRPIDEVAEPSGDLAPDEQVCDRRSLARVQAALAELPARDVAILELHFVEERTYREIAEAMAITPSRVCQLMWRAIDRLRAQLDASPARAAA